MTPTVTKKSLGIVIVRVAVNLETSVPNIATSPRAVGKPGPSGPLPGTCAHFVGSVHVPSTSARQT